MAIHKFLAIMVERKAREWMDVKELMPLQFMPYVAKLFREVTGKDLQGLSQFTGWIGLGGYYHWRVAQQGLLHLVPTSKTSRCQEHLMPALVVYLSHRGRPKLRLQLLEPLRSDRAGPTDPKGSGQGPTSSQGGKSTAPSQGGKSSTPRQSGKPASTSRGGTPAASEVLSTLPQVGKELVMVPGPTGTK